MNLTTPEGANRFLKKSYIRKFNKRYTIEAQEPGESAFVPCTRADLDRVFSIQTERTVNRDNTVKFKNMTPQIDKQGWRSSMEGCRVIVYQHFDETITIGFGPQQIGRYAPDGQPVKQTSATNDTVKRKPAPAFSSQIQTGHLTC